jgi:hypothetical protein
MTEDEPEVCVHCKRQVMFNVTIKDQWTHGYGGTYCLDKNGFTATPLAVAKPAYHGTKDVL